VGERADDVGEDLDLVRLVAHRWWLLLGDVPSGYPRGYRATPGKGYRSSGRMPTAIW
jgi:hypothetical protein